MSEIQFDEIREGDLIEVEYADKTKVSFVAARKGWDATAWSSPGGEFQITPPGTPNQLAGRTIRLLDHPGPSLPTEPDSVVLVGGKPWLRDKVGWCGPGFLGDDDMAARDWTPALVVPVPDLGAHRLDHGDDGWECGCGGWKAQSGRYPLDRANAFADHLAAAWGLTGSES